MITREEYLQAVDIVNKFHKQVSVVIDSIGDDGKTPMDKWLLKNRDNISTRLKNTLNGAYWHGELVFKFLEDVNEHKFLSIRNAGPKTWREFQCLIENSI